MNFEQRNGRVASKFQVLAAVILSREDGEGPQIGREPDVRFRDPSFVCAIRDDVAARKPHAIYRFGFTSLVHAVHEKCAIGRRTA
jgi:hypothetical protein